MSKPNNNYEPWEKKILKLKFEDNLKIGEIYEVMADELNIMFPENNMYQQKEKIRTSIRRYERHNKKETSISKNKTNNSSIEYKSTGEVIFEGIIELLEGEPITPEIIMKAHNLNSGDWEVVSYRSNFWQAQKKGGKKIILYQSRIVVKPKQIFTLTDFKKYLETTKYDHIDPFPKFEIKNDGDILEIPLADLHLGLLAWSPECGKNYDLKIAKSYVDNVMSIIIAKAKKHNFKSIKFVTLGDIFHVDSNHQTTTNGTFQQMEGRVQKVFSVGVDLMIKIIENLIKEFQIPLEYIYIPGNHDRDTGWYLAKTLEIAFSKEPNVTCDIEPNPMKARIYGPTLVGYHHGDIPTKNIGKWLSDNYRIEMGQTKNSEIHCGHLHSKAETEINNIQVLRLPSMCESSAWEHQQGYISDPGIQCFVWNEKYGKTDVWYIPARI